MEHITLDIAGMSCDHCVRAVTNALKDLDGVNVGAVKIGSADVTYDPARTSLADIVLAVDEAGYQVGPTQLKRAPTLGGA